MIYKKNASNYLTGLIILAGLILRAYLTLHKSMWLDEVITFMLAKLPFIDLIFQNNRYWDYSHPSGYYLLVKLWSFFGTSEIFLRLPALLSYLVSVYFLKKISDYFNSKFITFLLLTIFVFHPLLVQLGFELRMYSIIIPIFLGIIYLLFRYFLVNEKNIGCKVTIVLLTIVSFYIDYASIWLIGVMISMAFVLVSSKSKNGGDFLKLCLIIILGISPQIYILLVHFSELEKLNVGLNDIIQNDGFHQLADLVGLGPLNIMGALLLVILVVFTSALTYKSILKKDMKFPIYLLVSLGVLLPLYIVMSFSITIYSLFRTRNLVLVVIFVIISIGFILEKIKLNVYLKIFLFCFIVLYGTNSFLIIIHDDFRFKIDWKKVRTEVTNKRCSIIYIGPEKFRYEMIVWSEYYSKYPNRIPYTLQIINRLDKNSIQIKNVNAKCALIFSSESIEKNIQQNWVNSSPYCIKNTCKLFFFK